LLELTLRFAVRQGRIEYALVDLDNLEGDVEFTDDLVGVAFVHDFRYLAFEWVDELQRGFVSRPAVQSQAVYACSGGVSVQLSGILHVFVCNWQPHEGNQN